MVAVEVAVAVAENAVRARARAHTHGDTCCDCCPCPCRPIRPRNRAASPKEDVWSLGVILTELALGTELWADTTLGPAEALKHTLAFYTAEVTKAAAPLIAHDRALERVATYAGKPASALAGLPPDLVVLIATCLAPDAAARPTPEDLLSHPSLAQVGSSKPADACDPLYLTLRSSLLVSPTADLDLGDIGGHDDHGLRRSARRYAPGPEAEQKATPISVVIKTNPLRAWDLRAVYYFWKLGSAGAEAEFSKRNLIEIAPTIFRLPRLVRPGGVYIGEADDGMLKFEAKVYSLDTDQLAARLCDAELDVFPGIVALDGTFQNSNTKSPSEMLPLAIRTADLDYQFERMNLFVRILRGYPYTRPLMHVEASKDIPPILRGKIWAAILEVPVGIHDIYNGIDKETTGSTDHQLAVDIPRCHQYAPSALQFHPNGGQFDFVWLSARTMHPHGGASYVWCLTAYRNQEKYPPEKYCRPFSRTGTTLTCPRPSGTTSSAASSRPGSYRTLDSCTGKASTRCAHPSSSPTLTTKRWRTVRCAPL